MVNPVRDKILLVPDSFLRQPISNGTKADISIAALLHNNISCLIFYPGVMPGRAVKR